MHIFKTESNGEVSFGDIQDVNKFSNVFFEDLPGLPPNWEIKCFIDWLPGTTSISKVLYHMAPLMLKESKVQMHELLDKSFIHPCCISLGNLILSIKKKKLSYVIMHWLPTI